jgi:Sel1 repeat
MKPRSGYLFKDLRGGGVIYTNSRRRLNTMKRARRALALGLVLALVLSVAGWGSISARYVNQYSPEKGPADFDRDQYECQQQNRRPAEATGVETNNPRVAEAVLLAGRGLLLAEGAEKAARTTQCMSALGWERLATNQTYDVRKTAIAKTVGNELYAAAHGDAAAQNSVGMLYQSGQNVVQDYAEAMRWYRKSAAQGNTDAQNNIGILYQHGWGVTQDYAEAMRWYSLAANQGNAAAQTNVAWLYSNGWGMTRDYAEARWWFRRAARKVASRKSSKNSTLIRNVQ